MKLLSDLIQFDEKIFKAIKTSYNFSDFNTLLTIDKFRDILKTKRFVSDDIIIYRNGERVTENELRTTVRNSADPILNPNRLSNKKILAAYDHGKNGIKVNSIYDFSDEINEFRRKLIQILNLEVSINAYYSPAGSEKIFKTHRDPYNILILQIFGSKTFYFGKITEEQLKAESEKINISEGDALYLPANLPHHAEPAEGQDSLHLTIGLHPILVKDYVDFILKNSQLWHLKTSKRLPVDNMGKADLNDLNFIADDLSKCFAENFKNTEFLEAFFKLNSEKESIFE